MTEPVPAPCGSWLSPITAARVAAGVRPVSTPRLVDGRVLWLQQLPEEGDIVGERFGSDPGGLLADQRVLVAEPFDEDPLNRGRIGVTDDRGCPEAVETISVGEKGPRRLFGLDWQGRLEGLRRE